MSQLALTEIRSRHDIVNQVVAQFKEALIAGTLRPGDKIPTEPELGQQLGVSRTVVREAMKTLAAVGLVEIRRGQGTFISRADNEAPLEMLALAFALAPASKGNLVELREIVELSCGELVIARADDAALAAIDAQVGRFADAVAARERPEALRRLDMEFHAMLLDATGNPLFARMGRAVMTAFASTMQHALAAEDGYDKALQDHREIVRALERRSIDDYARIVRRSLSTWIGQPEDARRSTRRAHATR